MKINSLHYLRGLLALGVMLYHYYSWPLGYGYYLDANNILSRFGNYGVSLFFILSGLTLFHVYSGINMRVLKNLKSYSLKRFFRIYPLLIITTIICAVFTKEHYDFKTIVFNLSGLFGFTESNIAIHKVAWSVGNEIVFYSVFPVLLFLLQQRNFVFKLIPVLLFFVSFYYAIVHVIPIADGELFFHNYSSPLNHLFLFIGGVLIGFFTEKKCFPKWFLISLLVISVAIFLFYPVSGSMGNLICGFPRVVFSIMCFAICFTIYKLAFTFQSKAHSVFFALGTISYSLYLLHPIVVNQLLAPLIYLESRYCEFFNAQWFFPIVIVESILLSYFTFRFIEKPSLKFGDKFIS
jgi:exopolysaccharide production protein ExoZ